MQHAVERRGVGDERGMARYNLTPTLGIGVAMVVGGLGFKLAVFPFHAWAPDVYQGGPTPVTAFFATALMIGIIATQRPLKALFRGEGGWSTGSD